MKRLLLVRHGESEWNRVGRIQGQTDIPLTRLGIEQARRIAEFLFDRFDSTQLQIHVSPLQRARETAEIIASALGVPHGELRIDQRLNDFDVGRIAGTQGWEQVAIEHPEQARLRLDDPLNFHPPGGESGTQFWNRLSDFLDEGGSDDHAHLIVSHGIVNKFIRSIRRNLGGAEIIALGESQESVYELNGDREIEHQMETRSKHHA